MTADASTDLAAGDIQATIRDNLLRVLRDRHRTPMDLQAFMGWGDNTYANYMHRRIGGTKFTAIQIAQIALWLNVSADELLYSKPIAPNPARHLTAAVYTGPERRSSSGAGGARTHDRGIMSPLL